MSGENADLSLPLFSLMARQYLPISIGVKKLRAELVEFMKDTVKGNANYPESCCPMTDVGRLPHCVHLQICRFFYQVSNPNFSQY
ncbi:hypothetical protein CEXT_398721 [Caerostris extrusa]|uniref:Uncharacterized protein n=1 Tax=Caerostris extrusa TaxID=172846 RepID=A0AAV4PMI4_CAEEX|nr:hypothetical protein CEXT_398721 [Caerostris extrusa]